MSFPPSPAGTGARQSVGPRWLSQWQGEFKVVSGRPILSEQVSAGRTEGGRERGRNEVEGGREGERLPRVAKRASR